MSNEYFNYGHDIFGPFLYGFSSWLFQKARNQNIKTLVFLSRDGYMMKKSFDILNVDNSFKTEYIYVSRQSLRTALLHNYNDFESSLSLMPDERIYSFKDIFKYYCILDFEKDILNKFHISPKQSFSLNDIKNSSLIRNIYYDYKEYIDNYSSKQDEIILKYLLDSGLDKDCAIVDVGWHGNMQRYIYKIFKAHKIDVNICGYYVGIKQSFLESGLAYGYLFDNNNLKYYKDVQCSFGLIEKLLQSTEGSTKEYKLENDVIYPVLEDYEYYNDSLSIDNIINCQNGSIAFIIENSKEHFDNDLISFAAPFIKSGKSPSLYMVKLFSFLYNLEKDKSYYTLQGPVYKTKPKDFVRLLLKSPWKTGFLKSAFKLPFPYFLIYKVFKK